MTREKSQADISGEEEAISGHESNQPMPSSAQPLLTEDTAWHSRWQATTNNQGRSSQESSYPSMPPRGPLLRLLSRRRLLCVLFATLSVLVLMVVLGVGSESIANGYGDTGLARPASSEQSHIQSQPRPHSQSQSQPQSQSQSQSQSKPQPQSKPNPKPKQQSQPQPQPQPNTAPPKPKPIKEQSHGKGSNATSHKGEKPTPENSSCTTWANQTAVKMTDDPSLKRPPPSPMNVTKPSGFKIVGLVFFGRPRTVDILDCYLQPNLVSNGGLLDEVHFVAHTNKNESLDWLDELVKIRPDYKRLNVPKQSSYSEIWQLHGSDRKTLYLKIDDDIVWIDKDAIPRLIQSRLEYKEPLVIAANLINSPWTSWLHYRMGAIYPYLPESKRQTGHGSTRTWKPSELPSYYEALPKNPVSPEHVIDWKIPYEGHRWLPLRDKETAVWKTPIHVSEPGQFSPSWKSWAIAAQQHMSLFENIERDELWRYVLLNNGGMMNTQYKRYNINFVAIWGSDIANNVPFANDDEEALAVILPRKLGRPLLIDTSVLVGHYSFFTQAMGMVQTDILDRYRAYANEAICTADNQKVPLDRQCDDF